MAIHRFLIILLLASLASEAIAQRTDSTLTALLARESDPVFREVINHPDTYRLQIIYTRIDRNAHNKPTFHHYYYHVDPNLYFNPASMVKMPLAFLSLEKLRGLRDSGISKFTPMRYDSNEIWQHPLTTDTTSENSMPSIAQFIRRAFLISENDPFNRMYQFVGQGQINRRLHQMGYPDARIVRQFLGLSEDQNRFTNGITFVSANGNALYRQPPAHNDDSIDFSRQHFVGQAYYDNHDSLIRHPFDFTKQNNLSLSTMQQLLQSVLFPSSVPVRSRFALGDDDYAFLKQYLSQFPSETPYPKYDTSLFYDSYVKFFFRDSTHRMPDGVRVFNKVGWSYGFLTDVSYVADFKHRVEFMLAATVYVNSDEIINDDKYEYDSIGHPFLYRLGQVIYQHELQRKRQYRPNLLAFRINYEHRDPADHRPSLKQVDN